MLEQPDTSTVKENEVDSLRKGSKKLTNWKQDAYHYQKLNKVGK